MKLDRLSYLELVVYHKDFSLYEYPSRYCIIRIPLEKIVFDRPSCFVPIDFSFGQLKKLNSIGFFSDLASYIVIGHRPFDRHLTNVQFPDFENRFRDSAFKAYKCYDKYLKNIGFNLFDNKEF